MTDRTPKRQHSGLFETWLYDQRMMWAGEFGSKSQFELAQKIEDMLFEHGESPVITSAAKTMFETATGQLGMDLEMMTVRGSDSSGKWRDFKIIIPHGRGWISIIKQDPTTIAIYGDRKAGKTVTSWTIAWELYNSLKETKEGVEIHVFGDVDGIANSVNEYASRETTPEEIKRFAIVIRKNDNFEFPPVTGRNQIIIYNEINEGVTSKRGMAADNLEVALKSFRVRHEHRWMIFNIIRAPMIDITLREAPVKIIHHCTRDNFQYIVNGMEDPWRPIAYRSSSLGQGEGIAIYSLMGQNVDGRKGTTAVEGMEPHPPDWLLQCIETSKETELEHVDEVNFMKRDKDRVKKIPDEDTIREQRFTIYRDKLREAQDMGRFPKIDLNKVYWTLMDYTARKIAIKKSCSKNGIAYQTILDLRDEGFIEF